MRPIVWAGMATLTDRPEGRAAAIASLLPQVDLLVVSPGDARGDGAKFDACAHAPDVFLTVDDDLVYPPDYVERALEGLAAHPGCAVSFHGSRVDERGKRVAHFRCLERVEGDHVVNLPGTGVMAFRASTIRPTYADFPGLNADWWFAIKALREGVTCVVLGHEAGWLGYNPPPRTLWRETSRRTGSPLDGSADVERARAEFCALMRS